MQEFRIVPTSRKCSCGDKNIKKGLSTFWLSMLNKWKLLQDRKDNLNHSSRFNQTSETSSKGDSSRFESFSCVKCRKRNFIKFFFPEKPVTMHYLSDSLEHMLLVYMLLKPTLTTPLNHREKTVEIVSSTNELLPSTP